jgi:inosose dehydratase
MEEKRGTLFGCGMGGIALGDGVIDLPAIVNALKHAGFDGATTLEIAGVENVQKSVKRLKGWCENEQQ